MRAPAPPHRHTRRPTRAGLPIWLLQHFQYRQNIRRQFGMTTPYGFEVRSGLRTRHRRRGATDARDVAWGLAGRRGALLLRGCGAANRHVLLAFV
jgi:hypothetical protein